MYRTYLNVVSVMRGKSAIYFHILKSVCVMVREYDSKYGVCTSVCTSVSFFNRVGEKVYPMIGSRLCSTCKYFKSWRKGFVECNY